MSGTAREEDPLEKFWDDQEAIGYIKELFQVSDEMAEDLWHRFMGTVRRMRSIARGSRDATDGKD
jgi:hypothetical protein